MREIKFRAWDDVKDRMYFVAEEDDIAFELLSSGSFVGHDLTEGWDSPFQRLEHLKFMQYTGLKDKNGVEIYEGDIVHCTHWFFDGNEVEEEFIASVGFKDGSYTLENINSRFYSDYTGEENGAGVCWIGSINYTEDDYEVIGNVYEHPHLLKGE